MTSELGNAGAGCEIGLRSNLPSAFCVRGMSTASVGKVDMSNARDARSQCAKGGAQEGCALLAHAKKRNPGSEGKRGRSVDPNVSLYGQSLLEIVLDRCPAGFVREWIEAVLAKASTIGEPGIACGAAMYTAG